MGEALKSDKNSITDYLLDQEKLKSGKYSKDQIYEIEIEGSVIGPFWQEDLKEFLHVAGLFETQTLVRNLGSEDWTLIFEHPYFQRRKPSLVSAKEMILEQETFYVLKDGQKLGPYTDAQLQKELDEHNVLLNDFVSIDEGQSWGKLFELESFDRRKKGNQALPPLPEGHIFNNSLYDADKKLSQVQNTVHEKDALISLAYIGHLNEGKKKFHIDVSKAKEEVSQSSSSQQNNDNQASSPLIKGVATILAIVAIFSVYNLMSTPSTTKLDTKKMQKAKRVSKKEFQNRPKLKVPKRKVPKRAPARAKLKVNNTNRQITKGSTSIKNAAFLQAKELDNGYREEVELPPEVIFDDNSEAIELDPIRSRVSKDTIDPEFDEVYDEMEAEDFDSFAPVDEEGNAYDDAQLID